MYIHTHIYIYIYIYIYINTHTYIAAAGTGLKTEVTSPCMLIKGPHKATHVEEEVTSQHHHRGQETLRHEVTQAWGAVRHACCIGK